MTFNSATAFVPMLNKRARIVPNYKELDEDTWTYKITDFPLNYIDPDVTKQSDGYRAQNEPYNTQGIKMYGLPTGEEPIYGNEKTNIDVIKNNNYSNIKLGDQVYSQTKILQPFVDDRYLYKQTYLYKQPDWLVDYVGHV